VKRKSYKPDFGSYGVTRTTRTLTLAITVKTQRCQYFIK